MNDKKIDLLIQIKIEVTQALKRVYVIDKLRVVRAMKNELWAQFCTVLDSFVQRLSFSCDTQNWESAYQAKLKRFR